MGFMDILTHITKIQLKFEAELRGIRPNEIKGEYLQNYLDEFVYKLNRRNFNSIFDRLLVASVYPYWYTND